MKKKADIGVIGLGVMGKNIIYNLADHGVDVAIYNRTKSKVDDVIKEKNDQQNILPTSSIKDFIEALSSRKIILLMVKAGKAIDEITHHLLPFLQSGDIIIDGGNSFYKDTQRRCEELKQKKISFVGIGISGGTEGARKGPSLMPGGNEEAWPYIQGILEKIVATTSENEICIEWVGHGGAGHYVKMIHNAIEYGIMQLISESTLFLKRLLKLSNSDLSKVFYQYNQTQLKSYLIEITDKIFAAKDEHGYVIDRILDVAGQKGTGKWAVIEALEKGAFLPVISEAVFARNLSANKQMRGQAEEYFGEEIISSFSDNKDDLINDLAQALYFSIALCFAEGLSLLKIAANQHSWKMHLVDVAKIWMGGCIIQGDLLKDIRKAYQIKPSLSYLFLDNHFMQIANKSIDSLRKIVSMTAEAGICLPCFSAALSFFDAWRNNDLPMSLIQAQRDYFGAHGYERKDKERGHFFHMDWKTLKEKPIH